MKKFSQVFSCVCHVKRSFTYLCFWSQISSSLFPVFTTTLVMVMLCYRAGSNLFPSSNSFKFLTVFSMTIGLPTQLCHQHIKDCLF